MAISEKTFADRVGRAETMNQTTKGFSPPFTPGDVNLGPVPFQAFIDSIKAKNNTVAAKYAAYVTATGERVVITDDSKDRSVRSRDYVLSVIAFKPYFAEVKRQVKKIKGYRTPKKPVPAGEPEPKKRNQGEQSFADILNNFKTLIQNLTAIAGYAPTSPDLSLGNLTILATMYDAKSGEVGTKWGDFSVEAGQRLALYDDKDTGLSAKMIAIKNAVKSQYGVNSPEYLSIKGIKV